MCWILTALDNTSAQQTSFLSSFLPYSFLVSSDAPPTQHGLSDVLIQACFVAGIYAELWTHRPTWMQSRLRPIWA
jgi:hypothetical protein